MDMVTARNRSVHDENVLDQRELRGVCGLFVTGVAVVTSQAGGVPVGVTVNSFTSVSLDPPLVLFCIHHKSRLWPVVKEAEAFAVNILAEDQADVCQVFATKEHPHFSMVRSRAGRTGTPILDDALGYLECALHRVIDGGDHLIVIGRVVDLGIQRDGGPLTFFRSGHLRLEI
ncbi:flavin reductase family protein [Actinoallomurus acanthiterrae]